MRRLYQKPVKVQMRSLLLFCGFWAPLCALDILEQKTGFVNCQISHYQEAYAQEAYNLVLHFEQARFTVSALDLKNGKTTEVTVDKAVAQKLYRKLLEATNQVQVGGAATGSQLVDSFSVNILQSGFSLLLKMPSRKEGFDDKAIRELHGELSDLVKTSRNKP